MKAEFLIIILFIFQIFKCQVNYNPQFSRSNEVSNMGLCNSSQDFCEEKVKVMDEKPFSCNYNGYFHVLYPVIVEEFNYKEDIPNNWMFNRGDVYDDGKGGTGEGYGSWYGPDLEAYNNGNFDVINGKAYLRVKKEHRFNVPSGPDPNSQLRNYKFTNTVLYSKFYISGGTIITSIKLPNNLYMWPALWLVGKNSPYQEIDIFEFYDNNFSNSFNGVCDDYNVMRMSIWSIGNNNCKCLRGRRYPFSNFINSFNNYLIELTDFKLNIYLNNNLIGKARKYYDSPFLPNLPNTPPLCFQRAYTSIPSKSYLCQQVLNMPDCNISLFGNCLDFVKIFKDKMFPKPSINPMQIRFSNWLYDEVVEGGVNKNQKLFDEWNNFSQVNKEIVIDNIIIYHRVNCYDNFQVPSMTHFKIYSYGSNFLSGNKITIGFGLFNSESNFPIHILATNEIEFIENVSINEFLRADIINCYPSSGISQKTPNTFYHKYEIDYPPILINDSEIDKNIILLDSTSTDSKAINIFPNPTNDVFNIDINEEDLNYLYKIELVDIWGKSSTLEVSTKHNIHKYNEGVYVVKFYFTNGIIVSKPLIIKR